MYNIAQHYENIYQHLQTIIAHPRVLYLHPFGSTQPENIEVIRNNTNPPKKWGSPMFVFFDQEPLNHDYNKNLFDHIKNNMQGPYILVNTEQDSREKDLVLKNYKFAEINYFFHIFAAADWFRGSEFIPDLIAPKDRTLTKTYISFNRLTSNDRIYRTLLVNELYTNQLLEHGHVSFSRYCPDGGAFDINLKEGIEKRNLDPELVETAIANINQLPDLRIDFNDQEYIPNQSMVLTPMSKLMESFVFLVTETCFWQDKTHLTEKIFKPVVLRMPFILVGCANNLEYLRSYGFKTFGDYWDESYDTETDPLKRLSAIVKIVKTISNLSAEQQKAMLLDMQPILDHNYELFNSGELVKREWQHLTNKLSDICQYYRYIPPYRIDVKTNQAIPI